MAQQTAVDWLVEQLIPKAMVRYDLTTYNAIQQAKEMQKEQIINASRAFADYPFDENDIEQYYTETYNK